MTINGTAQAISSTPEETSASVFGAIASEASGVVGKAGGLAGRWADYRAIKTINDLSKLFGDQNVNYSADYMCGSTCKLNINIRE